MPESFGSRLKARRKEIRMSQTKLCDLTGISQANISLYENGKREPGVFMAILLADALGCSLDWLAGRSKEVGV